MLKPSLTNQIIKIVAYVTVGLSLVIALVTNSTLKYTELDSLRWIIALIVFISGTFNALFLFAISEALSRLQEMEYNTERAYKSVEHYERQWKEKASS